MNSWRFVNWNVLVYWICHTIPELRNGKHDRFDLPKITYRNVGADVVVDSITFPGSGIPRPLFGPRRIRLLFKLIVESSLFCCCSLLGFIVKQSKYDRWILDDCFMNVRHESCDKIYSSFPCGGATVVYFVLFFCKPSARTVRNLFRVDYRTVVVSYFRKTGFWSLNSLLEASLGRVSAELKRATLCLAAFRIKWSIDSFD